MKERTVVHTHQAPAAVGPYSQAVRFGDMLFTAGTLGVDPATGKLAGEDVQSQARQVLANLKVVLEAGGSDLTLVVKTTVFLTTMEHFPVLNATYAEYFSSEPPARSTVAVAGLPLGALVEIEAVAVVRQGSDAVGR